MKLYKAEGLAMLSEHATEAGGGYSLYGSVAEMDQWMMEDRFHVADDLAPFFEEYDQYHFDDLGRIVADHDDFLSAARYIFMMRRKMRIVPLGGMRSQLDRPTRQVLNPFTGQATVYWDQRARPRDDPRPWEPSFNRRHS